VEPDGDGGLCTTEGGVVRVGTCAGKAHGDERSSPAAEGNV